MDDSENINKNIDKCLFCLELMEEEQKIVNPKYCECKIKLHLSCLTQIENTDLLCSICRIKTNKQGKFRIIQLHMMFKPNRIKI